MIILGQNCFFFKFTLNPSFSDGQMVLESVSASSMSIIAPRTLTIFVLAMLRQVQRGTMTTLPSTGVTQVRSESKYQSMYLVGDRQGIQERLVMGF